MTDTDSVSPSPQSSAKRDDFLSVQGVSKYFGDFCALDRVNLDIATGEIFALLGASGSGKSTLLNVLAGLFGLDEGRIFLDGENLLAYDSCHRPVNMMFQSYALFPHMTVEKNIAFGLEQDNLARDIIDQRVGEMLALVHMESYAKRKPHQLSGGQQQRVALARSLAKHPKLLLLDEPMGALDKKLRTEMQFEIGTIIERMSVTCVMVTHDQEEAMIMADRIAIMDGGRILQVGKPREVYEHPNSRFTAEFIGTVNILSGTIDVDEPDHAVLDSADIPKGIHVAHGVTGTKGMEKDLALRPEYMRLAHQEPDQQHNKVAGTIKELAYFGSHSVYHVRLDSGKVLQIKINNERLGEDQSFRWEEKVWVSWPDHCCVVL